MVVEIIDPGNRGDKCNAICPRCGERVLTKNHWGDPPKCSCGAYYKPILRPIKYR